MIAARTLAAFLAATLAWAAGCSRAPRSGAPSADAGPAVSPIIDAAAAQTSAIFSAPVAGARVAPGEAIAVGLVVATKSITAVRLDASGHEAWRRTLIEGVTWSQDAELHAWPIAAGAFVVWRGPQAGKGAHMGIVVAPDGHVVDGPFNVGSLVCATDDGAAWSETAAGGTKVALRTWSAGGAHDEMSAPIADEVTLTCGAHRVVAVVDGDEGTPTRVIAVGGGPSLDIPPNALGKDEERDLLAWAEGDEVGLVRIAQSGVVTVADIEGGALGPVRGDGARVAPEDDVVAVDADDRSVALVTTHDESDACPDGRGGSSVHLLRIPRREPAKSTSVVLSPAACARDVGPFWSNMLGKSLVVGWTERASRKDKTVAPIVGLAYRVLEEGAKVVHVPSAADAIADAGCDEARCYAVILAREPGRDGMSPEAIRLVAYP
jgi:hypothetical protein